MSDERLEAEAPDEALRRRDFLERTAYTAGLAGLAATLPADTLVAEAAKRQRRVRLPSPRNMPIDTFVVLMMENRSFDHYLGWMPNADGHQAGVQYLDADGNPQSTHRLTPEYQGCGHPDPGHGWDSGRVQFNEGKVDGWLKEGSETDEFALGYYEQGDLGFIQDATKGTTTFDRFFCSILASTYPNREYMWAAQSYGNKENDLPVDSQGFPYDTTLFAAIERAGGTQYKGCGHPDPGHGWESGRAQLNGGFLAPGSGNDEFALTYFNSGELGFIHEAARNYTLYDRFFCSLLASTWPNRYYKWSAQSGGLKNNDPPLGTAGNQWETIFDRGLAHGLSARYYASDLPFSAVWGPRGATWTNPITRYYSDCAAGTLPNIAFVDPPFRDGGGGDGLSADEHPLGDVRLGQAFMADVVNAFVKSPNYRRGALFVLYDEWGGFFDHVTPPHVADDRASADLFEDFGQMGFRTPALAISPYARPR